MRMEITIASGISADGFNVEVLTSKDAVEFKNQYRYGYDASYSKGRMDKDKPYTGDVIQTLMDKYKIKRDDIHVIPGVYVFSGRQMGEEEAVKFIQEYMNELGVE